MEFVLEFGLRALGAGTDGFGVVTVECAGWFGVVAEVVSYLTPHAEWKDGEGWEEMVTYRLGPSSS